VKWEYDEAGTLTISGEGAMSDWSSTGDLSKQPPWRTYPTSDAIKHIIIEDGVTTIGNFAFMDCGNVESITIPQSVISFGNRSFMGCGMTELILPENLQTIDEAAFLGCRKLLKISIPESVESLGKWCFEYCPQLAKIIVYSPNCQIHNTERTFCNREKVDHIKGSRSYYFDGTLYGYRNSTLQDYAEKYSYSFKAIEDMTEEDFIVTPPEEDPNQALIGQEITFGSYEQDGDLSNGTEEVQWTVLDVQQNKLLLLSKYGLDCRVFHSNDSISSWSDSDLRAWLNQDFYNNTFDSTQKALIIQDEDTRDNVWLLSLDQANEYYDNIPVCASTQYAKNNGAEPHYRTGICGWWLRTITKNGYAAAFTEGSTWGGPGFNTSGLSVTMEGYTVRPAIWLRIADSDDENEKILHGSFYYSGTEDISGSEYDSCADYYYSDSYFYKDSSEYNPSLATMSLCLELSSFAVNDIEQTEWYHPDVKEDDEKFYKDKLINIKSLLLGNPYSWYHNQQENEPTENKFQGIGFSNFQANKDWESKPTADSIGVCAAKKRIKVPSENKEYTLIALVVRGGGYEAEWASNFTVGEVGDHAGFAKARDDVLAFFDSYYNSLEESEKNNIKLWITGYSRGAITANMVAGFIDRSIAFQQDYKYLNPHNIYCYTFEPPQGVQKSYFSDNIEDFSNIHNIININDVVPMVAPSSWGFTRYGNDIWMPSPYYDSLNYETQKEEMLHQLTIMGHGDYAKNRYKINDIIEVENLKLDETVKALALELATLSAIGTAYSNYSIWKTETKTIATHDALVDGLTYFSRTIINGRSNYYNDYQNALREIFIDLNQNKYSSDDDYFKSKLQMANLKKVVCNVFSIDSLNEILAPLASLNPLYTYNKRLDDVKVRFNIKVQLEFESIFGNRDSTIVTKLCNAFRGGIIQLADDVWHNNLNSINTVINFFDALKNVDYANPHLPEIPLAWLRSLDENYTSAAALWQNHQAAVKKMIANRVHISSDDIIINIRNKDMEYVNDNINYSTDNGVIIISLPADQNYILELVSRTQEAVSIAIDKYDVITEQVIDKTVYTNLPIQNNESVVVSLPAITGKDAKPEYTVEANANKIKATDVITFDDNAEPLSVNIISDGNGGIVSGGGTFDKGDFITVYAATLPDAEFEGWYSDDVLVSTQNDFSFIVKEDITLTAKFNDINFYELNFAESEHGSILSNSDSFPAGYQIGLYAQADEGYEFVKWQTTSGTIDNPTENGAIITMPKSNTIVTAVFKKMEDQTAIHKTGDVDGDGDVSVEDAQMTLQAYTNLLAGKDSGLTAEQAIAADVNGDGEVTVEDAQSILQYYTEALAGKNPTWDKILHPNQT